MTITTDEPIEGVAADIDFGFYDMIDNHFGYLSSVGMNKKIPPHLDLTQERTFVVESEYEYYSMGIRYKEVLENKNMQICEMVTAERNMIKTISNERSKVAEKNKQRSNKLHLDLSTANKIGFAITEKSDWRTRINNLKNEIKSGPLSKDELQLFRLLVFKLVEEYGTAFEEAESIERLLLFMKPGDE